MATKLITVFSEYEIKKSAIKMADSESTFTTLGCVGSIDESLAVTTVTKKCEGVVVKTVTRGAGTGEVKLTLHMKYNLYVEALGMVDGALKDGVYSYGTNSRHKEFSYVAEVNDEDGNIKYIAYPRCTIASGPSNKIENGGEEVQEIELTISIFPDENGNCKYECPAIELEQNDTLKTEWLTAFTPELVRK